MSGHVIIITNSV